MPLEGFRENKGFWLQARTQKDSRAVFMSQRSAPFEHVHHPVCWSYGLQGCLKSCWQMPGRMNTLEFNITDICFISALTFISYAHMQIALKTKTLKAERIPPNNLKMLLFSFLSLNFRHACTVINSKATVILCGFFVLSYCLNSYSLKHCNLCSLKSFISAVLGYSTSFRLYSKTMFIL